MTQSQALKHPQELCVLKVGPLRPYSLDNRGVKALSHGLNILVHCSLLRLLPHIVRKVVEYHFALLEGIGLLNVISPGQYVY